MTSRARALLWLAAAVVALVAAAWFTPYYSTVLLWEVRAFAPVMALMAILAAAVAVSVMADAGRARTALAVVLWAAAGLGALAVVGWFVVGSYWEDQEYSTATRIVDGEQLPELAPRAPFLVGRAQAGPTLGDVTGDIADVSYLPDLDRFSTLVERRGWLDGYEVAVTQTIAAEGIGRDAQKCRFGDRADARLGGWFGHDLGRLISEQQRGVRFSIEDAYAYCDGTTPMVVVPLQRQVGLFVVTERPAGDALYNGATGAVQVVEQPTGLPGPTYPRSLAARQREATRGMSGLADWWFDRSGWDAADDGANADNDSEFTLARTDGAGPQFVTPLTPRGAASSVVAVSTVPARNPGLQLAPLTVHRLDPTWNSPQAIVARIKADYADVCCYNLDQVFEVIPTGGDGWVATIGSEQALRFRVTGNGQLTGPEATCLRALTGEPIRCGGRAAQQTTAPPPGDPSTLNNAELADLQRRVAEEVTRRLQRQPG